MTLGELRTQITSLLNRRDASSALITTFIQQGLNRIQRVLRLPSMERAHYVSDETSSVESFLVPSDLLQVMDVFADGRPLQKVSFRELMRTKAACGAAEGYPYLYARIGASLFLYPALAAGLECVVTYYGEFGPLSSDDDENEATSNLSDILTYAALGYAGTHFKHDLTAEWDNKASGLIQEITDAAQQLDMNGGPQAVTTLHEDY